MKARIKDAVSAKASAIHWKRLVSRKVSQHTILFSPLFVKPRRILQNLLHTESSDSNVNFRRHFSSQDFPQSWNIQPKRRLNGSIVSLIGHGDIVNDWTCLSQAFERCIKSCRSRHEQMLQLRSTFTFGKLIGLGHEGCPIHVRSIVEGPAFWKEQEVYWRFRSIVDSKFS